MEILKNKSLCPNHLDFLTRLFQIMCVFLKRHFMVSNKHHAHGFISWLPHYPLLGSKPLNQTLHFLYMATHHPSSWCWSMLMILLSHDLMLIKSTLSFPLLSLNSHSKTLALYTIFWESKSLLNPMVFISLNHNTFEIFWSVLKWIVLNLAPLLSPRVILSPNLMAILWLTLILIEA
jgi:hypothetical protein